MELRLIASLLLLASSTIVSAQLENCLGYSATHVVKSDTGLKADLGWAGAPCNVYGYDLGSLSLEVDYDTNDRLHVKIYDPAQEVYQVPASVFPRPVSAKVSVNASALSFTYTARPFSFAVQRQSNGDTLFNTSGFPLIFESQYIRLRTSLPENPNLYGLGEHSDPFKLGTTNYTRTLWSRDAYTIPNNTNLYGNHPVYFDNRGGMTHGVFLLNSNGMDVKIDKDGGGQFLEYNAIGGIFDLYFLSGPDPVDVAKQYSRVAGLPAMVPYWSLGFQQCRYGMQDVYEVAGVVYNYSKANIPLETMYTDIDYMDARKVFTVDPERFPLKKIQELVKYLHDHGQHYIMMVDPAVAYQDYGSFDRGADAGIFMKYSNGSIYQGVVWPGVTAFPDWFNPNTQGYWTGEFKRFFNPGSGIDIDGLWIDLNEASNFCPFPCSDPQGYASENGFPPTLSPARKPPIPLPGFPADFQPGSKGKRQASTIGLRNLDYLNPPYAIANAAGALSNKTVRTDLIHDGAGYAEYDTHNLYGSMMSTASRAAMLARKPNLRTLIITRSTFAGAGTKVGKWLGDNAADWYHYRLSIAGQLGFSFIYQVPMVGSDVCGFAQNTTEMLCARWAMLGAFSTFYRNHQEVNTIFHEFYRFPLVTKAAQVAIDIRYRLLDYIYTAMYQQSFDGSPTLNPLWAFYPSDANTYPIDLQFFYGPAILVSPVTEDDSTSVSVYLPHDQYYDWYTLSPVQGTGATIAFDNVDFTTIPLHVRGGNIVPLRNASANTTTALRNNDFNILIAPGRDKTASGQLYLDDGVSLVQDSISLINFEWDGSSFIMDGTFGYDVGKVVVCQIQVLGQNSKPATVSIDGSDVHEKVWNHNKTNHVLTVTTNLALDGPHIVKVGGGGSGYGHE